MRRLWKSIDKRFGKYYLLLTEYPLTGLLDDLPFSSENQFPQEHGIPPIVYQTWEENKFGKAHLNSLKRFRELNSDLSFCLVDAPQRDEYMQRIWGHHPIYKIYQGSLIGPMKVDVFRYCLILERGGYYFDINKCVMAPLTGLHSNDAAGMICFESGSHKILPSSQVMSRIQQPERFVAQWGFAFEKGSPVLQKVIDLICEYAPHFANRGFSRPKNAILQLTGPGMFTKAVWAALEGSPDLKIEQLGIDFNGLGNRNIPGSHVRYLTMPNYDVKNREVRILEL